MLRHKKLWIFDKAGTVGELRNRLLAQTFRQTLRPLCNVTDMDIFSQMGRKKADHIRYILAQHGAKGDETKLAAELEKSYAQACETSMVPIRGTKQAFQAIRAKPGVKIASCTGLALSSAQRFDARLARFGVEFDYSISSTEVTRGRPAPDMIYKIMYRLGVTEPKYVVKVGDTDVDGEEARNAGVDFIFVDTGIPLSLADYRMSVLSKIGQTSLIQLPSVASIPFLL